MFALFCFLVAAEAAVATQREDKNRPVTKVAGVAGARETTVFDRFIAVYKTLRVSKRASPGVY